MATKPAYSIADQIALLKQRGMLFRNEALAPHFIKNISYYHQIKSKILDLFEANPTIPIYKLSFLNNWQNEPLWK